MRSKLLIVITATLCLLISTYASLPNQKQTHSSQERKRLWEKEVPTPVQEGVLTPQQKEHSKLYDAEPGNGKISDLLQKQPELTVAIHSCPALSPEGQPPMISELAEKADAIVIGSISSKSSQITSTGIFVFTDYAFGIEEVLKGIDAVTPKLNSTITITRPGGKVLLNGGVATVVDLSFQPLMPGRRYVLFLKYLRATGAYQAVSGKGSYDISGSKVETLTDGVDAQHFETELGTFITSVKLAIEQARKSGGAR
jgi:hypothetical protein